MTEFRLFGQKLYLSPILDLYSGDIMTYTLSDSPNLLMVTTMLEQAFAKLPDDTKLLLHSGGASLKEIQSWAGHANFNTPVSVYTHVTDQSNVKLTNTIGSILSQDTC